MSAAPTTVPAPAARPACPPHLAHFSLGDVELYYREGRFPYTDLIAYLRAWNAGPGRFTQAVWRGNPAHGQIVQIDPEELTNDAREFWRELAEECGANIAESPPAQPPRKVDLKIVNASGANDPHQDVYYAGGKRITREEYYAIRRASVRLTEQTSASVGGVRTYYQTAYVPVEREGVVQ